jgi:hypothetical protein
MMDVLYTILKTIFVSQIAVYLLLRLKCSKHIRLRLLFLAKRLCKNWWLNLFAAWALSSFVLTSYLYVFSSSLWLLAIIPFFLFGVIYMIIVFRKNIRERLLTSLKAINFYLIASIGQIIVFIVLVLVNVIMWYAPINDFTRYLYDFYSYNVSFHHDIFGVYIMIKEMFILSICLSIPYLVLFAYASIKLGLK